MANRLTYPVLDMEFGGNYSELYADTINRKHVTEICRRVTKQDIATLRVRVLTDTFTRTAIKRKHSFSDKLSSFGGFYIGKTMLQ
jgi:hypothetical protein